MQVATNTRRRPLYDSHQRPTNPLTWSTLREERAWQARRPSVGMAGAAAGGVRPSSEEDEEEEGHIRLFDSPRMEASSPARGSGQDGCWRLQERRPPRGRPTASSPDAIPSLLGDRSSHGRLRVPSGSTARTHIWVIYPPSRARPFRSLPSLPATPCPHLASATLLRARPARRRPL